MKSILRMVWQSIPKAMKIITLVLILEVVYCMSTVSNEGKWMILVMAIALFPIYVLAVGLSIIDKKEKEKK